MHCVTACIPLADADSLVSLRFPGTICAAGAGCCTQHYILSVLSVLMRLGFSDPETQDNVVV